jgi:hypothetical protein
MNTLNTARTVRMALACAAALFAGAVWADSQPDEAQASQSNSQSTSQDVGGAPLSTSASGAPMAPAGLTREQVYQDLVRSGEDGERAALQKSLYHGQ